MTRHHTRRRFLAVAAIGAATGVLAGCAAGAGAPGREGDRPGGAEDGQALPGPLDGERTLVTFFSVPETDDAADMTQAEEDSTHVVDGEVLGNTQYVAQLIAAGTGADVFRIETAEQLPLDHSALEDLALEWQENGARPELGSLIPDLDQYDTVFVGYPIWWYDLPMPMHTFFEEHDFGGKTVVPFSTHGGSGLSGTVEVITELLPETTVSENAFTISQNDMDDAATEVNAWLDTLTAQ
jgi:flavodoxin